MVQWIKKGDRVKVIAGNERGRIGTVLRRKGKGVVIQGLHIFKKHVKRHAKVQTPSIIEIEMPIHLSNVILCDEEGNPLKLKVEKGEQQKELTYERGGEKVSFRKVKKY